MMQPYLDITGHDLGKMDICAWFGQSSDNLLMDQRLLWMALFAILITNGADPISLDRMFQNN
jgi:putative oxidoreductase